MTNTDIIQINLSLSGCVSITSYSVSWNRAGQSHFITTWKTLEKFPSNRCRELHPQHCQQSTGGKAGEDTTVTSLAKHHSKQEWALAARVQLPPVQHSYRTTAWELKKPIPLGISHKLFPISNVVPSLYLPSHLLEASEDLLAKPTSLVILLVCLRTNLVCPVFLQHKFKVGLVFYEDLA